MTMMPRGRGQNDAAVKSHPRRCSERHKEDAKAACPRLLLCANTKYTIIASLVSNDEKAKVVVLLLRASCDDDVMICLEHTQQTRVSVSTKKTKKKRERERERRKTLSLNTQKKVKKVFCLRLFCVHTKNAPIDRTCGSKRLVTLCNTMTPSSFSSDFFFFVSLSLDKTQKKKTTHFLKP